MNQQAPVTAIGDASKPTEPPESFQRLVIRYRMQSGHRQELISRITSHPSWNSLFIHHELFDMPWSDDLSDVARDALALKLIEHELARIIADAAYIPPLTLRQMCDVYGYLVCHRRHWNRAENFFGHERAGVVYRIFRNLPPGRRLVELRGLIGAKHIGTDEVVGLLMDFSDKGDAEHIAKFAEFRVDLNDIYPLELSNPELIGLIIQAERLFLGDGYGQAEPIPESVS